MTELTFRPSSMREGEYLIAVCLACRETRYLGRNYMIEKAGDVPINRIFRRLRCFARPKSNKRGPACGGRMDLEGRGATPQLMAQIAAEA